MHQRQYISKATVIETTVSLWNYIMMCKCNTAPTTKTNLPKGDPLRTSSFSVSSDF